MNCRLRKIILASCLSFIVGGLSIAQDFDRKKAMELMKRERAGETLSPEEAKYLDEARAEFRKQRAKKNPARKEALSTGGKEEVGLTPLNEFAPGETYKGQDGGLYGEYKNEPPAALRKKSLSAAGKIQPLDKSGKPSPSGSIGLVSHGMSNGSNLWTSFMRYARSRRGEMNPYLKLVDGAIGGKTAKDWAKNHPPSRESPWDTLDSRITKSGLTNAQVQVMWLKHAQRNPATLGEFPDHSEDLEKDLAIILDRLQKRFPNLGMVYFASRIYGGYSDGSLNPEPYAYEQAFGIRSVILNQSEDSPVLLWAPYTWADGVQARKLDELTWIREDFRKDGTHPSETGGAKIAQFLWNHFTADPSCEPWFTK